MIIQLVYSVYSQGYFLGVYDPKVNKRQILIYNAKDQQDHVITVILKHFWLLPAIGQVNILIVL